MNPDVKREEISFLVKEMMENENGKKMKGKAMEWKQMAEETTKIGGSSYENFNKFMEDVLCYGK
ncbi:hypothetical protein JCGZ_00009 [Jatropha curcas]|uniref:Uncharacterized protein n=2 Tax=Jatropha curcas TaxID=180498 RepID=A0A067J8U7_JATCU|nr:hypothetical protein JCGZ_00009 [Jatropha curcas]